MAVAYSNRTAMMHIVGAGFGIAVALLVSSLFGESAIGWGIGVAIIAVSAALTFVPEEKRNALRLMVFPVVAGIVMWGLVTYIGG